MLPNQSFQRTQQSVTGFASAKPAPAAPLDSGVRHHGEIIMNWEAIGAVGEVMGALFVFITLIYLSVQIRSNSKMLMSQNIHSATQHLQDLMGLQVHPDVIAAAIKEMEGKELDLKDSLVLEAYTVSMMIAYWNRFEHHKQGLSSISWEDSRKSMADFLTSPWMKKWWNEYGSSRFSKDFVHEVNLAVVEETSDHDYHQRLVKKEDT